MTQTERRVAVFGAAGAIGEAITRRLAAGAIKVAAIGRDASRLEGVRASTGVAAPRVRCFAGSLASEVEARSLVDRVVQDGPLDGVVATLGPWRQAGSLVSTSEADLAAVLDSNLLTHLRVARVCLPLLAGRPGSVFLQINGGAADHPVPGAGPVCLAAAALKMMGAVLAVEARETGPELVQLQLDTPVMTRDRLHGQPGWLTSDLVAERVYALVVGQERPKRAHIHLP